MWSKLQLMEAQRCFSDAAVSWGTRVVVRPREMWNAGYYSTQPDFAALLRMRSA